MGVWASAQAWAGHTSGKRQHAGAAVQRSPFTAKRTCQRHDLARQPRLQRPQPALKPLSGAMLPLAGRCGIDHCTRQRGACVPVGRTLQLHGCRAGRRVPKHNTLIALAVATVKAGVAHHR